MVRANVNSSFRKSSFRKAAATQATQPGFRRPVATRLRLSALTAAAMAVVAVAAATPAHAGEVEVLHWWTSGGEARAAQALRDMITAQGDTWKDYAVAGGGGDNALTALKTRVVSGQPPTAAQIKGPQIQEWGNEGVLADIDAIAADGKWDAVLPPAIATIMKYQGHYVAAPINVHRVNWLWVNPALFAQAGATVPTTMAGFFEAADKLKAAGVLPIAHGGDPMQDATLFESVALGVGGVDFYRKAFIELDAATLSGPTMIAVFDALQRIKGYIDKGSPGRDWNLGTVMVMNGKAAMQFMGDWAKGEFTAAGKVAGTDYLCVPAPGTAGAFTYNIDSLAMFTQTSPQARTSQAHLATAVMSPEFQTVFNLNKGSIPARIDVALDQFDACARQSSADLQAASSAQTLIPSFSHKMAMSPAVEGGIVDVVSRFMHSNLSPKAAAAQLAAAVKAS